MIDLEQMEDLIGRVLSPLGSSFTTKEAVMLVLATGLVESGYKYLQQLNEGPARGFWQVEPDTAIDNCVNYIAYRPGLLNICSKVTKIPTLYWASESKEWGDILESNIAAGIVHCRMKYRRSPEPLPSTKLGYAKYWKKNYNTHKGAGKLEHFIKQWDKYIYPYGEYL